MLPCGDFINRVDMVNSVSRFQSWFLSIILVVAVTTLANQAICESSNDEGAYDPLLLDGKHEAESITLTAKDSNRDREIPLRVYLPSEERSPAPVVLFSHGLGGSRDASMFLGEHWAARGYVAVFLQHPGSDESVWRDKPPRERLAAMRRAASLRNFRLRVGDVSSSIDALEVWVDEEGHPLQGRIDLTKIGMAGHSFGAMTTQAVSGQRTPLGLVSFTDERIRAAIPMSPSKPDRISAERAFGAVEIPWLLMTGTHDDVPEMGRTMEERYAVFPALPPGGKYELVLHEAEHSVFIDHRLRGDTLPRNPNHHPAILALSTAFWDAYLLEDERALEWLDGDGPSTVLEENDRWQRK